MSYHPPQGHNPYPPQGPGHSPGHGPPQGDYYEPANRRRDETGDTVANIIRIVTGVVVTVFVLHILFVVFDANQGNEFVSFVYGLAQVLVLGLGDVFTPDDALLGVILNYGLAALVYLVIGRLIVKAIRR
ncbi:hypothetical protein A8924_3105 [Saccharopolyspora erythraea NRRL 2338]|uniref:Integral membrane protein n=1 Tax=Saccharopolyspora erythraea TaxID=1836 RepID=A0ABP3NIK7_SACER|nr:hypothetical protein [Saccharopolyspora erythraea]PFG95742.1 hypothetical protein A8924_3105 [Saccharopolyspora erythraea NRRL 2338]